MKAPSEVDTLRDESCPVCGETDAWDGDACKVCGFVAPPDKFQDPDVDMHKRLDLRNNTDLGAGDVSGLNADINDRDGDGLDDNTGLPIEQEDQMGADDAQPMLVCPNCGYEAPAAEPQSVDTRQPQGAPPDPMDDPDQAEETAATGAAAEGDLCPNCGQAPLESPTVMAQEGVPEEQGAAPAEEQDPDGVQRGPRDDEPEEQKSEDDEPDTAGWDSPFDDDEKEKDESDAETDDRESDGVRDVDSDDAEEPVRKKAPPGKK